MSFLPDLAGWALSGGAGRGNDDDENTETPQESEEEVRAKRLASLAARFDKKDDTTQADADSNESVPTPMEVDSPSNTGSVKEARTSPTVQKSIIAGKAKPEMEEGPLAKKSRGKEPAAKPDPARKLQRKKEMLLKKTLKIKLTGGCVADADCTEIDIGKAAVTVENISEILASRLAISPKTLAYDSSSEKGLISYLGSCHKKVAEELKNMPANASADTAVNDELKEILQEMKRQVVSYAATSLMAPDLFELAKDGPSQLAQCLENAALDPASSITIGVAGKNSSFYSALCDELVTQDESVFESVVMGVVKIIREELSKCESVLENSGSNGLVQVTALTALCSDKKAAIIVARTPQFLLPSDRSTEASERVSVSIPPPPAGATPQQLSIYRMMTAVTQGRQSYLKRSGPALEKETLLGLVLRLGTPMESSAVTSQFQNVARSSRSDVKKRTDALRRQLKVYQDAVHSFLRSLITAGEEARTPVRYI